MNCKIDFDDPSTFPSELSVWDAEFEREINERVNGKCVNDAWRIEKQLCDINIKEKSIVTKFFEKNSDREVAVHHCTRILSAEQIMKEGLITGGGRNGPADKRLRDLLSMIKLSKEKIEEIMTDVYSLWDSNGDQKTKCVHFQLGRDNIIKDIYANAFAANVGGEILDSVIGNRKHDEPYRQLYIIGTPSIVKFKCKLSDIVEEYAVRLLAEIVKYYIVTQLYSLNYEFCYTGMTKNSVPPSDIIEITPIKNYDSFI